MTVTTGILEKNMKDKNEANDTTPISAEFAMGRQAADGSPQTYDNTSLTLPSNGRVFNHGPGTTVVPMDDDDDDDLTPIERPSSVQLEDKVDLFTESGHHGTVGPESGRGERPQPAVNRTMDVPERKRSACSLNENEDRGSRWSISFIRRQFEEVRIEDLYLRYWLRLQRILLFKLLMVITVYGVVVVIAYNTSRIRTYYTTNQEDVKTSAVWVNVTLAVALCLALVSIVLVLVRDVFFRIPNILAAIVWLFLLALIYAFAPWSGGLSTSPVDNVPMTFYSIFVIHTMLPTPRRVAFLLGAVTGLADVVLVGVFYPNHPLQWKIRPMLANSLIYLCANLTGLYHKHLTDLAHRHTFLDSRKFIEADIKYSRQREMQIKMKEGLLTKVIPRHLVHDMKKALNRKIVEVDEGPHKIFYQLYVDRHDEVRQYKTTVSQIGKPVSKPQRISRCRVANLDLRRIHGRRPFRYLHLEMNDNVSILYADIVNFTPLTESLGPGQLVQTLNELFGRFDELAKVNNCMRIKMLGDCYYCVSGLPNPLEDHARNCVIMGMYMIKVIRNIRKETGVADLDMRIGINSGFVLSGVLGLKKWQYDVWSDDVIVANHMEAGGQAGKVHITKATHEKLGDEFKVVAGNGAERSEFLKENGIDTYFIADSELEKIDIDGLMKRMTSIRASALSRKRAHGRSRRVSVAEYVETWGAEKPFDSLSDYMMERTFPEIAEVNSRLERGFHLDRSRESEEDSQRLKRHAKEIHPLTLRFRDSTLEAEYENMRDSSFKFYTWCAFVIFVFMVVVQLLILAKHIVLYVTMATICLLFILLLVFTTGLKCLPCYSKFYSRCQEWLRTMSDMLISNKWCKVTLSFVSCGMIFVASTLPLFYYLFSCMLALISCSVFLRIPYVIKTGYMVLGLVVFNTMSYYAFDELFNLYDTLIKQQFLDARLRGILYTGVLCATLIVLDRQIGKNLRLDFLCKLRIKQDKEEVRRNELLNELLLSNILPRHVAEHFTRPDRGKKELYHERCHDVCVMFAAIPNFNLKTFFSAIGVTGKECLRLLNEIISSFDKMLVMRQFDGVEKIKTIGSTYMAAAGLQHTADTTDEERAAKNAVIMVRFAFAMMKKLDAISKDAFYEYKLRIGLNHGEAVAGVVGASKPQYDIWGDVVNVASRMESHGVMGRIQVREETAQLLMKHGIMCDFRDRRAVKGKKKPMNLYLVSERSLQFERMVSTGSSETCDIFS